MKQPIKSIPAAAGVAQTRKVENKGATQGNLSGILSNLRLGRTLTSGQMTRLREQSPLWYQRALAIKHESQSYRKGLESCRSKAQARRQKNAKLQQLALEALATEKSSLSSDEKQSALEYIEMRRAAIQEEHNDFTQSVKYQRLPEHDEDEAQLAPVETKKRGKKRLSVKV